MLLTSDALVNGEAGRPGVAVLWRQGSVLAFLFVGGLGGEEGVETALALARWQSQKIENPAPAEKGINDDREVALDNPRLGIDVWWLGARFDRGGELPPLTLEDAVGPLGPGGGPGNVVKIDYGAGKLPSLTLDISGYAGREPPAPVVGLDNAGRRRLPHAGASIGARACPQRPFDRFLAHVYLDDVVVAVNMPYCLACAPRGPRGSSDPYDSLAGMEAVARALTLRRDGAE